MRPTIELTFDTLTRQTDCFRHAVSNGLWKHFTQTDEPLHQRLVKVLQMKLKLVSNSFGQGFRLLQTLVSPIFRLMNGKDMKWLIKATPTRGTRIEIPESIMAIRITNSKAYKKFANFHSLEFAKSPPRIKEFSIDRCAIK